MKSDYFRKLFNKYTVILAILILIPVLFASKSMSFELTHEFVAPIEKGFLSKHIFYHKPTPELPGRICNQVIKRYDSSKLYLLKKDVQKFKDSLKDLFKISSKEKYAAISDLRDILAKRMEERLAHIEKYLGKDFKIDEETSFILDPNKRKFPETTEEADKNVEKFVQFQISNYLISDIKLEEAKTNVINNYKRGIKRIKDFDSRDLLAFYLDSFANGLDPHSSFFSKDVLEDFEINMKLSLEGIGALLRSKDGFTQIIQLIDGGAAKSCGKLKPGDKIVAVAQGDKAPVTVIDMDLRDVVKLIRGKAGSIVKLTILRKESEGSKKFIVALKRTKVNLEDRAVKAYYFDKEIDGKKVKLALISLPSFYSDMSFLGGRSCAADMKKLLKEVVSKDVKGVVLDLSTNGGGSLADAVKIAGMFFKTGNVVKQSTSRIPGNELLLSDTDEDVDYAGPLVVLTSRISASASEIVAGTLQDYKRAVIVGTGATFGKGSVQTVLHMGRDIGALKITVGMYYIPSGRSTQMTGVVPDIKLPTALSSDDIGEKILDDPLPPCSIKNFISKEAFVSEGKDKWEKINDDLIKKLAEKSAARVKENKKFQKIVKDRELDEKSGGLIKLSTQMKRKQEAKEEGKDEDRILSKDEMETEYLKRPDIIEAIDILYDFVKLENR